MARAADNLMDLGDMDGGNDSDKENLDTKPLPPDRYVPVFYPPPGQPMLQRDPKVKKRKDATPLKETKQAQPKKTKAAPTRAALEKSSSPIKKHQPDVKAVVSKPEPEPEPEPKSKPAPEPAAAPEQAEKVIDPRKHLAKSLMIAQVNGGPVAAARAREIIASRRLPSDDKLNAMPTQLHDEIVKQKNPQVLMRVLNNSEARCRDISVRTSYLQEKAAIAGGSKTAHSTEDEIEALRIEGRLLATLSFLAQDRLREIEERKAKNAEAKAQNTEDAAKDTVETGE